MITSEVIGIPFVRKNRDNRARAVTLRSGQGRVSMNVPGPKVAA